MNRRDYDTMAGTLTLREAMSRLLEDSFVAGGTASGTSLQMPLDVYETGDALTVRASLPGVTPDDIDITVTGDTLTLRAELRDTVTAGAEARYHQREHRYGAVARSLTLPVEVQPDKVEASFEHGVLTLTMPKAARLQPRSIKINTGGASATSIAAQSTGSNETAGASAHAHGSPDRATSTVPATEYVSVEDRGTAGAAATNSSPAGTPGGGPSDADADATPSPS